MLPVPVPCGKRLPTLPAIHLLDTNAMHAHVVTKLQGGVEGRGTDGTFIVGAVLLLLVHAAGALGREAAIADGAVAAVRCSVGAADLQVTCETRLGFADLVAEGALGDPVQFLGEDAVTSGTDDRGISGTRDAAGAAIPHGSVAVERRLRD